jgi:HSP20 family molecular chaperone IbpA
METNTKIKLLSLIVGLCLLLICGLGYYSWQLSKQLQEPLQAPTVKSSPFGYLPDPWPRDWGPRSNTWDPSGRVSDLQKMMDDMVNSMSLGSSAFNNQGFGFSQSSPQIIMEESAEAYNIAVSIPKGQEVELNTELSDNQLKISGQVNNKTKAKPNGLCGGTHSFNALSSSRFSQTMTFPAEIDEAGMTINHGESEITIKIPKKKAAIDRGL